MKCILCQYWKKFSWRTEKHTGVWIYQTRGGERRVLKGPRRGDEPVDQQWLETGVWKSNSQ